MIVDTSPSISDLSVSCLSISDGVFIPIKMNKLDFKGVRKTLSTIKMVRDVNNSKVTLLGNYSKYVDRNVKKTKDFTWKFNSTKPWKDIAILI